MAASGKSRKPKTPPKRAVKKKPAAKKVHVAVLEVTTWAGSGVVWWAQHYYGKLKGSKAKKIPKTSKYGVDRWEEHELEYPINAKEAKELNKEADSRGYGGDYKVGDMSTRFFGAEKMLKVAVEKATELGYTYLIRGSSSICSPQRCLMGPKMDALNEIWERYEKFFEHTNDPDWKLVEPVEKEWERLAIAEGIMNKHGILNVKG